VDRASPGSWDLALVAITAPVREKGGARDVDSGIARVVMLDRGLRRSFDPAVDHEESNG
jgi:hypothetical protein